VELKIEQEVTVYKENRDFGKEKRIFWFGILFQLKVILLKLMNTLFARTYIASKYIGFPII
jgi:hypothetical protein